MVLLRELDDAKDYPLVIHPVGSDWERQVRAHYTRADGTLNINCYYSEMSGFTVKSSDFESDSVATISTSMEISSRFTTDEFVSTFRQAVQVSGEGGENRVMIDPVAVGEFVTTFNEQEPNYFYMYTHVLQTLHLWLPFNSFECQILKVMNVAPCQLHPNSWAFFEAFQVACEGLDVIPTAGIFFCFFHVKNVSPHSLISISSQPNKGRFSLYASNFKNYRDTFVRFRCGEGFPELMFDASGGRLIPFYWSSSHRLIKGTRLGTLNEYERLAVSIFSRFQTRAQRAEAERAAGSADAMSQLVVEESGVKNIKRKNPEESGRIPVEIPKKRKSTVVDEEEAEIEDEPLQENELPPTAVPPTLRRGRERKATSPPVCSLRISNPLGALLTYYLSNRQELESIDFRNKMESADNSLSALDKEFTAAKRKFEEDLAVVKVEQEEKVKAAVKDKDDEVVALKGRVKTLEGELTEEK
ncbi:hypothetical protein TSUD_285390 [Trifolium subterraneum]|uniref:Transposase (putative) gypsy type domain-containing protein n=1 Tax=Trifolium subterraneum TaxID=3900 RepID=A0A2Z6PEA5_TRISU|nr:hypothetical protein TSUD_285390 [Trifolium subterraneum]